MTERERLRTIRIALLASALTALSTAALADPCEAPVTGYKPGGTVAGVVRYVVDADGLCIGPGRDPRTWTEVRLADFYGPELNEQGGRQAKAALERLVKGRRLVCTATKGIGRRTYSYDRLLAVCTLDGISVGTRLRRAGALEGGRGRSPG